MPMEFGLWRIDEDEPRRLAPQQLPSEKQLEDFLSVDPSLLGKPMLIIARQLKTDNNKYIDLLGMDVDGNLHVLELKRDKTPRDVVAQALDYGAYVKDLGYDEIKRVAQDHLGKPLEEAFADAFDSPDGLPDELNAEHFLSVVASELDSASERIVGYLQSLGVPIDAIFFNYVQDGGREYLARTWMSQEESSPASTTSPSRRKRADWNGIDWFVSFGGELGRKWADAKRFGFVSAGGGDWYSASLKKLPVGARIFVNLPKRGYVAVGETTGAARPFGEVEVEFDGKLTKLADLNLVGNYQHQATPNQDTQEYVVPVRWITAWDEADAYWEKGMFANQNSACKLSQPFTIERLHAHFGVDHD